MAKYAVMSGDLDLILKKSSRYISVNFYGIQVGHRLESKLEDKVCQLQRYLIPSMPQFT